MSGPVAVEERLVASARSLVGEKESRRMSETSPGMWVDGAQKGSL